MAHIVLLIVADSHSSYRLACLVMQIILFALFLLSCISLGLHRTIRSKGLMFELTIYIVCIVDVRLIRPGIEYSPFSALLLFRLVSLSTEFITFQLYKTAYNFLILALEMIITFFLLKVTAFSSKLMIVLIFSHIAFHVFKEVNLRHHLKGIFILLPFGQFQESVVSTIRILDGNNWSDLYYSSIRDKGPWSFVFYFLLIVLGRYIIFSIMLAVFLDRMKSVKSGHTSVSQQSKLHKVEVAVLREIQKKRNTEILPIESQRSNELFENDTSIINKASNEKGIIEKTLAALNQGPPKRFLTNRGTLSPNILRESNEPEETERKGFFNEDLKESILEKGSVEEFEGKVPQLKRGNQRKESLNRVYPIKKQNPQVANLSMIREVVNFNTQENIETKEKESRSKLHYCTECSLFLLHQDSRLRKKLKEWTTSNFFDNSVIGLIIFGAIILAVDSPMLDPNSLLKKIIYYIDLVLNIFFSVECILKILSDGFIYNSRKDKAYIRDSWNIMDFVVVILSWLNYFIEGADGSLKSLKALRALRGLRPLRVVRKSKTLKLIVETILTSVLKMVYYLVFLAFVITPVAIISMNFYSKMHSSCQNRTSSLNVTYGPCRSDDPMSVQTNLDLFSSYPQSILTSFIVMSGEGFDSFFHELNINQQTQNLSYWFIFITFLNYFLGNVFVESTFACLTILHYVELQTVMEGTASLNQKQRNIFDLQKIFIRKTLVSYVPPIKNKFMLLLKKISESYLYDIGHLLLFAANVSFLFFDDTDQITFAINTWKLMQIFILTLYHLDIFFKFFSVGFFMYFNDGFNNIDFFSVILCDVLLIVRSQYSFNVPFVAPIFLRFFSLGRFLRRLIRTEFKIAKNFKNIMDALQISVLNLMPLFGILFIFISIFAIIGMYLFYRVPFQVEINYIYNFQNFISSFITLFRTITGYHWNETMNELSKDLPNCYNDQSYQEILEKGANNCGNQFFGILFMLLYFVFGRYLLLNMITVLVIEGYSESKKLEGLKLTDQQIDSMIDAWSVYDRKKTGLMEVSDFLLFINDISPPFGMKKVEETHISLKIYMNRFLMSQNQRIILSDLDVLKSLLKFGLQVYEVGDSLCIHYVDYISVVTNRLFDEPFESKDEEVGKDEAREKKKDFEELNNQTVFVKRKMNPVQLKQIKEE